MMALLLASCGSNQGENLAQYNFKQGYEGLKVKFMENSPPEEVYPFSEFKIIVELENLGAYDITDGTVAILGLEEKYFFVYPPEQEFDRLLGRSLTNPSGDLVPKEFDVASEDLFQNAEEYVGNYFLKVNYNSEMEFADSICIKPNLYSTYDAGCEVEEKSYRGQGGPLAVTKLVEIISPGSGVEFRLDLENKGRGKVGTATLRRARLGNEPIECRFSGEASDLRSTKFDREEQKEVIICRKAFIAGQSSYTTTLSIEFSYDYELVQQEKLTMVK
ncbi:MAG TPA: hypothetical protein VJG49_04165 [Candidatus Nanoarchaeia archaeon]|nr:hypothetical protein [Candidatus Nanoarchaeia archaeon]